MYTSGTHLGTVCSLSGSDLNSFQISGRGGRRASLLLLGKSTMQQVLHCSHTHRERTLLHVFQNKLKRVQKHAWKRGKSLGREPLCIRFDLLCVVNIFITGFDLDILMVIHFVHSHPSICVFPPARSWHYSKNTNSLSKRLRLCRHSLTVCCFCLPLFNFPPSFYFCPFFWFSFFHSRKSAWLHFSPKGGVLSPLSLIRTHLHTQ